jgi:hypothetical protein
MTREELKAKALELGVKLKETDTDREIELQIKLAEQKAATEAAKAQVKEIQTANKPGEELKAKAKKLKVEFTAQTTTRELELLVQLKEQEMLAQELADANAQLELKNATKSNNAIYKVGKTNYQLTVKQFAYRRQTRAEKAVRGQKNLISEPGSILVTETLLNEDKSLLAELIASGCGFLKEV